LLQWCFRAFLKDNYHNMLRWRLLLGTLIIASLAGLCWLDLHTALPGLWLLPVAIVAAVLAGQEVLFMARAAGMRPLAWPVYVGNVLLVLFQWQPVLHWCHYEAGVAAAARELAPWTAGSPFVLWPLAAGVLMVFLGEMVRYQKPGGVTANIAVSVLALVYVGLMLAFAVHLRTDFGMAALVTWVIVVKMGDIGAYTIGRLFGRHKLAPHLSPGKTIEGALGALVFACLAAWVSLTWLAPAIASSEANALATRWNWGWLPYGLLLGLAGMLGDLAESLLKRDVGLKDSSSWMPGFGGVLDILDALLLSAPVAWVCWQWGMVP
jgi:phosphatidate cytidylyltransferase